MKNKWYAFPVGALTTLIFFLIGFLTGKWNIAWLIFLLNPIFYWYIHNFKTQNKDDDDGDDLDF